MNTSIFQAMVGSRPSVSSVGGFAALVFASLMVLAAGGCNSSDGPQRAAEEFLDAHYVRMDLEESSSLAEGLAVAKIAAETALLAGIAPDESFERPRVNYSQTERRPGEGSEVFGYTLQIQPAAGGHFTKQVLLTVRGKEGGGYSVTNFSDRDALIDP